MGPPPDQTCDSCGEEMSGYTRNELEHAGWVWHEVSRKFTGTRAVVDRVFVMCASCCEMYEERRKAKRPAA